MVTFWMALYTESRMFNPIKVKGRSGLNCHLRGLEPGKESFRNGVGVASPPKAHPELGRVFRCCAAKMTAPGGVKLQTLGQP